MAKTEAVQTAKHVLHYLSLRRIEATDDQKHRLLNCDDLDALDRWVKRMRSVSSADELFA
jgi:hypothetical protein